MTKKGSMYYIFVFLLVIAVVMFALVKITSIDKLSIFSGGVETFYFTHNYQKLPMQIGVAEFAPTEPMYVCNFDGSTVRTS